MIRAGRVWCVAVMGTALALLLGGCLDRELKPLNPCLVSGVADNIPVTNIDKVDLLFMVDNSGSMREEQEALRTQFPRMITVLTTGDRDLDGESDFPPAADLHLAVVSSDMGLFGISGIDGCSGFGDDGVMQNTPDPGVTGCQPSYPPFIRFIKDQTDPVQTATDFGCIASLGTDGCGFEQQLEATLKALWPAQDRGGNGAVEGSAVMDPNRIRFLGDPMTGAGTLGHGDGMNAGFLRNDSTRGISLIAVILVTDEEDCSSANTRHFTPPALLDPNDPLAAQDLNLRCYFNKQNLYDIKRYIDGFKALRPDDPQLVIFGGIVGVPADLVTPEKRELVNFDDPTQSDAYYDAILADDRMQETPDPNRTPQQGGNLTPSCDEPGIGKAYPPRRIVEVAKGFGPNGIIQSICQSDFTDAIGAIIDVIAKQLGAVCLPRPLIRDADGFVGCDVVWVLPAPGTAPESSPTSCDDPRFPFLELLEQESSGRQACLVNQLPAQGGVLPMGVEGWFYDDFTQEVMDSCRADQPQRVAFTPAAKPPTGVTVRLECLNETQSLVQTRTDLSTVATAYQPNIGSPCENVEWPPMSGTILSPAEACSVTLMDNTKSAEMVCHPDLNVCVKDCSSTPDCPAAWVCDKSAETINYEDPTGAIIPITRPGPDGTPVPVTGICVNPTCGGN